MDNRLATYTDNLGNSLSNQYSDDGLRRQRTLNSITNNITYDEVAALLETSTSGTLNARYTNYPGGWGGLASQNRGGTSSYYGCDSQTSVRILVSPTGAITDSYSTKAFGEPLQAGSGTTNPHVYGGKYRYRLQSWGGQLLSVRIEDPTTGRFSSVDPTGFLGGSWNLYGYVGNVPTSYPDPLGLQPPIGLGPAPPRPGLPYCWDGRAVNIRPADPRYSCYEAVCQYAERAANYTVALENALCIPTGNGLLDMLACRKVLDCLPDERAVHAPRSRYCDDMPVDMGFGGQGRNKAGWDYPGGVGCCQECGQRVCYWMTGPFMERMLAWQRHALQACHRGKQPHPAPALPRFDEEQGLWSCLVADAGLNWLGLHLPGLY